MVKKRENFLRMIKDCEKGMRKSLEEYVVSLRFQSEEK